MTHPSIKNVTFTPTGKTAVDLERIRAGKAAVHPALARAHAEQEALITPPLPETARHAVALLSAATFRPFTAEDWQAYAGCETPEPRIAELGEMTLIMDGLQVQLILTREDGGLDFKTLTLS